MPRRCDQTLGVPVTRWELTPTIPPVGMLTANIQNIFNMNIDELNSFLQSLPGELLDDASQIVSETAQEYFKDTFRLKAFDGNPWTPARRPKSTGSLLVNSSALLNSIRPAVVTPERVVISAGNDKVTYAAAHNEGYRGPGDVPAPPLPHMHVRHRAAALHGRFRRTQRHDPRPHRRTPRFNFIDSLQKQTWIKNSSSPYATAYSPPSRPCGGSILRTGSSMSGSVPRSPSPAPSSTFHIPRARHSPEGRSVSALR